MPKKPPTYQVQPEAPYQPQASPFDFGTSGLYADQFQALQDMLAQQQGWSNYVYDQWLPGQMGGQGGGPDLGAFRSLMASPNAGEEQAAMGLFDAIAAPQGGPGLGQQADMAQAAFMQQMWQNYWQQAQALQQQRAQSLQGLAMAIAEGKLSPEQAQNLGQNLYGFAPGDLGYFGTLAPQQGGLDPEDQLALSQEVVKGLSEFEKGHQYKMADLNQAPTSSQKQGIAAGTVRQQLMAAYAPMGNPQEVERAINDAIARYYGHTGGGGRQALAGSTAPGPSSGGSSFFDFADEAVAGAGAGALAALLRKRMMTNLNPAGYVMPPSMEPMHLRTGSPLARPPWSSPQVMSVRPFGQGLGPKGFGFAGFGLGGHTFGQK